MPDRKILIKERIGAELVKLMGLEIDESYIQRQSITNPGATKLLTMNKQQQEGIRRYVKFLIEQLK